MEVGPDTAADQPAEQGHGRLARTGSQPAQGGEDQEHPGLAAQDGVLQQHPPGVDGGGRGGAGIGPPRAGREADGGDGGGDDEAVEEAQQVGAAELVQGVGDDREAPGPVDELRALGGPGEDLLLQQGPAGGHLAAHRQVDVEVVGGDRQRPGVEQGDADGAPEQQRAGREQVGAAVRSGQGTPGCRGCAGSPARCRHRPARRGRRPAAARRRRAAGSTSARCRRPAGPGGRWGR